MNYTTTSDEDVIIREQVEICKKCHYDKEHNCLACSLYNSVYGSRVKNLAFKEYTIEIRDKLLKIVESLIDISSMSREIITDIEGLKLIKAETKLGLSNCLYFNSVEIENINKRIEGLNRLINTP